MRFRARYVLLAIALVVLPIGILQIVGSLPARAQTGTPSPSPSSSSAPSPTSGGGVTCADFATQQDAQAYFEAHGGSASNNVDNLDPNGNGIACEGLPGTPTSSPTPIFILTTN